MMETEEPGPVELQYIELEMAYTPYLGSCRDPAITPAGDIRQCRRAMRHTGTHASGFGKHRHIWPQEK